MIRDWLAFCFCGSISLWFGNLWLCKEMLIFSTLVNMCMLPSWTVAILYARYNRPNSTKFETWWYACVCVLQFVVGLMSLYLYAWLKADLEAREREEHIKLDQGKIVFERQTDSVMAMPCGCKLWD